MPHLYRAGLDMHFTARRHTPPAPANLPICTTWLDPADAHDLTIIHRTSYACESHAVAAVDLTSLCLTDRAGTRASQVRLMMFQCAVDAV